MSLFSFVPTRYSTHVKKKIFHFSFSHQRSKYLAIASKGSPAAEEVVVLGPLLLLLLLFPRNRDTKVLLNPLS